eukprot:GGOE01056866.1.p1 GENE.GGOE01056866.1~~GGOE01056866.1.p1  ORF type:complete len:113 (+),score=3.77 GGOE01056866.1:153-491(+)
MHFTHAKQTVWRGRKGRNPALELSMHQQAGGDGTADGTPRRLCHGRSHCGRMVAGVNEQRKFIFFYTFFADARQEAAHALLRCTLFWGLRACLLKTEGKTRSHEAHVPPPHP